jgi:hypothetical protein
VYVSDKTAGSRWVNWEIEEAVAQGKKVVAMYKGKSDPRNVPPAIEKHKIKVVPWNQKRLSSELE